MFLSLRLERLRHPFRSLSTALIKPPVPTHDRIKLFLDRLKSNKIPKSAVNSAKQLKLLNLDTQIEQYDCERTELHSLIRSNPELVELGRQDTLTIQQSIDALYREVLSVLYDSVSNSFPDECIVEIRSAAGGAEAALFVKDLLGMYRQLANRNIWHLEELYSNMTDIGGYKNVSLSLDGKGCYEVLRFEAGVHRVQRVPTTSSAGKIHTSTVTVAVLSVPKHVEVI